MRRLMLVCLPLLLCVHQSAAQNPYVQHNSSFGNDIRAIVGDTIFVYSWSLRGRFDDCEIVGGVRATDSINVLISTSNDPTYFSHSVYLTPRSSGVFVDTINVGWGWNQSNCGDPNHTHERFIIRFQAIEDSGFYFRPYAKSDTLRNDEAAQASRGVVQLGYANRSTDAVTVEKVRAIGADSIWTRTQFDPARYGAGPIAIGAQSEGNVAVLFETKNAPHSGMLHDTLEILSQHGDLFKLDTVDVAFISQPDDHLVGFQPALIRFANQPRSTSVANVQVHHLIRARNIRIDSLDNLMSGLRAKYTASSDTSGEISIQCQPATFDWNGVWRTQILRYERILYNGEDAGQAAFSVPVSWSFSPDSLQSSGELQALILHKVDTLRKDRESNLATFRLTSNCAIDPALVLYDRRQGLLIVDSMSSLVFQIQVFDAPLGANADSVSIYAAFTDTACGYGDVLRLPIRYFVTPYVALVDRSNGGATERITIAADRLRAAIVDGEWMLSVNDAVGRALLHVAVVMQNGEGKCERLKSLPAGIYWFSLTNRLNRKIGKVVLP